MYILTILDVVATLGLVTTEDKLRGGGDGLYPKASLNWGMG